MSNRAAKREIAELEDKWLSLHMKALNQEGDAKAATLEQVEAAKKTLDLTRWSYEMVPPSLNSEGIKTT